jgi:hypothetical protein
MAKKSQRPFEGITPRYDVLLRGTPDMPIGLAQLHLATAEQLCRLHYSMGSLKGVKAKLRTLVDYHYVQYDAIPTKFTRSPYYYALDRLSIRYLAQAGTDVSETFRAGKEVNKHSLFVEHTLELNDILIAAALLKRSAPNYWLDSFIHERVLKRRPYKATWQGGNFSLIPDAFLDFRVRLPDGSQRRMPILIEHDRGSEEQRYFRRRIRAYSVLLKTEAYKLWFQAKGITIAFTTFAGPERLKRMRDWTRQELAASGEPKALERRFYFTNLVRPIDPCHLWLEPCWYTPCEEDQPISLLAD